jgi:hypothetical protein
MMSANACPGPEAWAELAAGAVRGEAWRLRVRHLADCPDCRRLAALLGSASTTPLPAARLQAPLPLREARPRGWIHVARAAAAAVVLGAAVYALVEMNRPRPSVSRETAAPPLPLPPKPAPAPRIAAVPEPESAPLPAAPQLPPLPPFVPEEPAPTPAPAPAPSPYLARHEGRGVAEPVELASAAGAVAIFEESPAPRPVARGTLVAPSQPILTPEGGAVTLPDGATVHVSRGGEIAVSWSRTHLCYSLDVRRGEALVELGEAPRLFHVASGALGVRLQDSSGRLWVAGDTSVLRASPISAAAAFRAPGGEGRILEPRQALVLAGEKDGLEPAPELESSLAARFPSLKAPTPGPPPVTPSPKAAPEPSLREPLLALSAESYRYRVSGRFLREGAWLPGGILASSIDELSVVRRTSAPELFHARRGARPWDDLGPKGAREDRLLAFLRAAPPPHLLVEKAHSAARGAAQVRADVLAERACLVSKLDLDPASARPEMEAFLGQAVADGRMPKPDQVFWDGLSGTLEIAVSKGEGRVLRVVDRRQVSYLVRTTTPGVSGRRTWSLETVYEFHDHGRAQLRLPAEIIRDLER